MSEPVPYSRHARTLLILGLPLIGGNVGQMAVQVIDTLMLGWYDVSALAAVILGSTFWFVLFILGSGLAWAVSPLVAAAEASGDHVRIRRVSRMGLWASALYAVAVLPLMWFSQPLLSALGQDPDLAEAAQSYLRITGWGMIPALGVMVLKSYLAAMDRAGITMWITLAAAAANAALNYALIFGNWGMPELGIRGSAIASLMVHVVSIIGLVIYARRVFPEHDLFRRLWRPDWEICSEILRMGGPIGLTSLAEVGLFSATSVMMGWLGEIPLAAHGIALQVISVMFMVHVGLAQAATILAGRAMGRGDTRGLARGGRTAIAMSLGFAVLTIGIFVTLPALLIGMFVDPADPDRALILATGVPLLLVAAVFQLADAMQVVALGLLRGIRDTKVPMLIAAIAYWPVGMPVAYLLGFTLDYRGPGVWMGLTFGLGVAAILLLWRFWGPGLRAVRRGPAGAATA